MKTKLEKLIEMNEEINLRYNELETVRAEILSKIKKHEEAIDKHLAKLSALEDDFADRLDILIPGWRSLMDT